MSLSFFKNKTKQKNNNNKKKNKQEQQKHQQAIFLSETEGSHWLGEFPT